MFATSDILDIFHKTWQQHEESSTGLIRKHMAYLMWGACVVYWGARIVGRIFLRLDHYYIAHCNVLFARIKANEQSFNSTK